MRGGYGKVWCGCGVVSLRFRVVLECFIWFCVGSQWFLAIFGGFGVVSVRVLVVLECFGKILDGSGLVSVGVMFLE